MLLEAPKSGGGGGGGGATGGGGGGDEGGCDGEETGEGNAGSTGDTSAGDEEGISIGGKGGGSEGGCEGGLGGSERVKLVAPPVLIDVEPMPNNPSGATTLPAGELETDIISGIGILPGHADSPGWAYRG